MKNVDGKFRRSRELMIEILFQFFNKSEEKNDHFVVVLKQMIQTKSCDFNGQSMEELLEIFGKPEIDFAQILKLTGPNGHNILMSMAKYEKDEALSEFLTNRKTSKLVSK